MNTQTQTNMGAQTQTNQPQPNQPATIILIHGAWHGGWVWDEVATGLRKLGREVLTPTLKGTFQDNVDQIEKLVVQHALISRQNEELSIIRDVILVGHSSAGLLIQMVAPKIKDRLEKLIFINAFILPYGVAQFNTVPQNIAKEMTAAANASSDGCVPVNEDFVRYGLMAGESERDIVRLTNQLTPQHLSLFTTPITEKTSELNVEKAVIFCKDDTSLPEGAYLGMTQSLGEMSTKPLEIDGGHETIFTNPDRVIKALRTLI